MGGVFRPGPAALGARAPDAEVFLQDAADYFLPTGVHLQLFRTRQQVLQPADKRDDSRFQIGGIGVQQPYRQAALAGVVILFGDSAEQAGPAGDGFVTLAGFDESVVQAPPVIDQGDQPGSVLTGREGLRGEAAPASLVIQFVKWTFRIAAFTIQGG